MFIIIIILHRKAEEEEDNNNNNLEMGGILPATMEMAQSGQKVTCRLNL